MTKAEIIKELQTQRELYDTDNPWESYFAQALTEAIAIIKKS
jgi:hypothetical protein